MPNVVNLANVANVADPLKCCKCQENSISQIEDEHHYLNKEDKTSKLHQEIISLQKTNEALKVDNNVAKRDNELLKSEITSLRSTNEELSYENDRLNWRLNCIIEGSNSYIMANRTLNDTNNDLKLQVDNMHSEITSLKNEILRYKTNDENKQERLTLTSSLFEYPCL